MIFNLFEFELVDKGIEFCGFNIGKNRCFNYILDIILIKMTYLSASWQLSYH